MRDKRKVSNGHEMGVTDNARGGRWMILGQREGKTCEKKQKKNCYKRLVSNGKAR